MYVAALQTCYTKPPNIMILLERPLLPITTSRLVRSLCLRTPKGAHR